LYTNTQCFNYTEENTQCAYYDDKLCDIQYRYMDKCTLQQQQTMLERGWRRFGNMHFVPQCKGCNACTTLRIDIENFNFSKSHKRVLNKNKNTEIYIQKPTVTYEHLELFNKYHKVMQTKKGWEENKIDPDLYCKSYVDGANEFGKELLYFIGDKLVAVALIDILPNGISSIYCYYDHDFEELSLGKFSILSQILLAKQHKISYLYLGYWIKDHPSMGYKEYYKPFEILENRPLFDEEPIYSLYKEGN